MAGFGNHNAPQGETLLQLKTRLAYPSMFKVIMLNDDFTPMDFVMHVLQRFFSKSPDEAQRITWDIHNNGSGLCGIYTHEVAETKVTQVNNYSTDNQHPLLCVLEKV
ncbi:ATP-dependent Clp protease adapter ClpS [Acetobacteraceae bacterium ESL0709]|nr:ATP-dependent Clp protease adapter ClpS [Acetobacteraceae bacterium ESL0697]MDF7677275.1 ATP-dependent Clp protease adapter ClpS [Acetobacteraceae bacterium ESL0709]